MRFRNTAGSFMRTLGPRLRSVERKHVEPEVLKRTIEFGHSLAVLCLCHSRVTKARLWASRKVNNRLGAGLQRRRHHRKLMRAT